MTVDHDELMEQIAAYAHHAWSGWIRYMFSKCGSAADGSLIIPVSLVERWTRQSTTEYAALPESEKASDREEADKILAIAYGGIE